MFLPTSGSGSIQSTRLSRRAQLQGVAHATPPMFSTRSVACAVAPSRRGDRARGDGPGSASGLHGGVPGPRPVGHRSPRFRGRGSQQPGVTRQVGAVLRSARRSGGHPGPGHPVLRGRCHRDRRRRERERRARFRPERQYLIARFPGRTLAPHRPSSTTAGRRARRAPQDGPRRRRGADSAAGPPPTASPLLRFSGSPVLRTARRPPPTTGHPPRTAVGCATTGAPSPRKPHGNKGNPHR